MALILEQFDRLLDDMRHALVKEDWQGLSVLDASARPLVESLMAELRSGEVPTPLVQERLEELQAICQQAQSAAVASRDEARKALEGMRRTSSAARTYQDVSGRRSR
ncbi:hypothetical protein [Marinobacter mobilis]|uniref:Flagellar protein FliT n=1 Tax=Marinobacter mobilis TaxID=488533 RepID=A0A1H2YTP5_9GAMM|nr:hypothetical protein [Marinobacter mobilis]SDX08034.1 hypothetical protein SAMN04487960_10655 [Marinobacter mobilis]